MAGAPWFVLILCLILVGAGGWWLGRFLRRARSDRRYREAGQVRERAWREMMRSLHVQTLVLANSGLGIAHVRDRCIQWANPRWGEIFGVSADSLVGVSTATFHQDAAAFEAFGHAGYAAIEREGRFSGEVRLRRMDGSPFWGLLVGSLLESGRPEEGAIWCLEDVSTRVEAQQERDDALKLNQKLFAASPTGILLYRAQSGECILANQAAARGVGGRVEDLLRQNFRRNPVWAASGLLATAEAALVTGTEQMLETALTTSFGQERSLACTFVPFEARGMRILLLMLADVTEQAQAAAALRESQERYRVVVEALNEGLIIVGPDQRYTYCNTRLADMLGYTVEELLGMDRRFIVAEDDLARLEALRHARPRGATATYEVRLKRKGGTVMDALLSIAPILDDRGRFVASPVLVTDISVRKRSEREREQLLLELEQKNKELETLVYVASHDLRSPLVNIQGFSQRLGKSLDELERQVDSCESLADLRTAAQPLLQERMPAALEYIRASGVKMDAIINGLLRLSRAGRMVLRSERLDMNRIMEASAAAMAFQLQEAEGVLQLEPLPPCQADPVQIAQVFSNLLDNAIKYRRPGQPLVIRVSGRLQGALAVYCVEDNGIGISTEHRARIFDIFQRLDPQGPTRGEGLGLTLVRRMVERNGGRIWVESAAGAGSRFCVELPAV
ncbi:MAG: PAS domain S-box protein [Holophaga sp.]|nr:PAS domain S-box protein [Holophaga sp.]